MLNNLVAQLGTGADASATSFESIATATGTGSSGTITFSSIPSTYKHLQIRYIEFNASGSSYVQFNSDSSTNYISHQLAGGGASASASAYTAQSKIFTEFSPATASIGQVGIIDILDYASTSKNKVLRAFTGVDKNGSGQVSLVSGLWLSTSAINSITLGVDANTFLTGTTFALYGIKG